MPSIWVSPHKCKVTEKDEEFLTDESVERKKFNFKIVASKKPYFMTYVYPKLKAENDKYIKNNNKGAIRRFNKFGINSIEDLEKYENKTDSMQKYYEYYKKLMPVGNNPCVVNKISWFFEDSFRNFMTKFSKHMLDISKSNFDYNILKSGVVYSKNDYKQILEIYEEYNRRVEKFHQKIRNEKIDKDGEYAERQSFIDFFKSECYKVCSNEDELCDIILDICYQKEKSKQFVWDIMGDKILNNLLKNNNYTIHYPKLVESDGDFVYGGNEFKMCEKKVEDEF